MLKQAARFGLVFLVTAPAVALGLLTGLTQTRSGRHLVARAMTDYSGVLVRGSLEIGGIRGNLVNTIVLDSVVVRDTSGIALAVFPRIEADYALPGLLAGRVVLDRLQLWGPKIYLRKHRDGRFNFEEVLKLGEGDGGGRPALILFREVRIVDGIFTLRLPWSPPGQLASQAARDSALRAQRRIPGRRIEEGGSEGLVQVRTVQNLNAVFPELRISTPDRQPIRVVVDSLAAEMNDPLIVLTSAQAEITTARDTLWFTLPRLGLPDSRLHGEGYLAWPRDTLLYNAGLDAPKVALRDLRFISPDFPDLEGRGRVDLYSVSGRETHYDIRDLDLRDPDTRIAGSLVAITHKLRGLGFDDLDLQLTGFDLVMAEPYLDTIPFQGRLSGRLRADGFFEDMVVAFDWTFADSRIPGTPPNRIAMRGRVSLGGPAGMTFHGTEVTAADLDLATVRLAAPAVVLQGRATGEGVLEGPWRDVVFRGRIEHRDGDRPESMASGTFGIDTRSELTRFDADFAFAPLSFDGIRPSFPSLTAQGRLWGPVRLQGPLDSLFVRADLQGELGRVQALGVIIATPPRWGADSLLLQVEDLDLAAASATDFSTRLTGRALATGVVDSGVPPEGQLRVELTQGAVREVALDSLSLDLAVRDGVLQVDTAAVWFDGAFLGATGTLGWAAPRTGTLTVAVDSARLEGFDSLLVRLGGLEPDTTVPRRPLGGALTARVEMTGALDSLAAQAEYSLVELEWNQLTIPASQGRIVLGAKPLRPVNAEFRADSIRAGRRRFAAVDIGFEGPIDSLGWRVSGRAPLASALAAGRWVGNGERLLTVDSLSLDLASGRWRLVAPAAIRIEDSIALLQPIQLQTLSGSARLEAEGNLPWRAPGELDVRLLGLDLRDLYALLERDTAEVAGILQADLRVAGTGASPTIRGTAAVTGPVLGDFRGPLARAALNYRDQRLDANLSFWRTGTQVMDVSAALPLSLAWLDVPADRLLPGDVAVRARADGMDLGALEAFTPNLRRVQGSMLVDAFVSGTWDEPRLGGSFSVQSGYATVPGLGVTYGPINGEFSFSGDTLVVDTVQVGGETGGQLDIGGVVELQRLTLPVLNLRMNSRGFRLMNVPGFLTLEADADVRLTGPLTAPVLTGSATAQNSLLYFTELITKNVVNLENPLYSDLVDQEALRRRRLGSAFQSRFLDSLAIRNFGFLAAERVWLRSAEANIQLRGSVTVNKVRENYRVEGTFSTPRGTYTLQLWPLPVDRTFEVTSGTVQYLGTPDLDAALDIEARHVVRYSDVGAQDVAVIAHIQGTLQAPRLRLESTIRPPLSQSDIVSLLLLGRPLNTRVATTEQQALVQTALSGLASALAGQIQSALVASEQLGLDLLQIRPGVAYSGVGPGTSLTRLSAGWQLGERWWVTLNAGFCPDFQQLGYRNFGAGLEYRLSRALILSASAEPAQICLSSGQPSTLRYQFGTDLRWTREY